MRVIDGSQGEGGGQILRTSLALSAVTGEAIRLVNLRARREKPGLRPQHLMAVKAAAEICDAEVLGAEVNAKELSFRPRAVRPGSYVWKIGTAGASALVVQTVLVPLSLAGGASIVVEGGTHNTKAPPVDYLSRVVGPLLARAGVKCHFDLDRHGFYPVGGGRIRCTVAAAAPTRFTLLERGPIRELRAHAISSRVPEHVAERELATISAAFPDALLRREEVHALGPGNAIMLEVDSLHVTELFTGVAERGVRAERIAQDVVDEAAPYVASGAPVGPHLADQLLLPLALLGGGAFRMQLPPTLHFTTNVEVIESFLGPRVRVRGDVVEVDGAR